MITAFIGDVAGKQSIRLVNPDCSSVAIIYLMKLLAMV
jgi:hypothetical protein